MYENLEQLMKDESFLSSLAEVKTADDYAKLLLDNGIEIEDVSKEEAFAMFNAEVKKLDSSEELTEDNLDDVSGGVALAVGAVVGTAALSVYLAAGCYSYYKYLSKRKR